MNALFGLLILHFLILQRWHGQKGLELWLQTSQEILRNLEARQYIWDSADQPLRAVFQSFMRRGRLEPQAIRSLLTQIRRLERADAERRRVGYGAAVRLGLAAALGLGTSLILEGSWFLRLSSNPPALLLLLGDATLLTLWLNRLKPHALASSTALQVQFTSAWLGQSQGGPWHETWIKLQQRGQLTGRDLHEEQTQLLEDWLLTGTREQEKRLTLADELFGLVELASSVYFLGTACALPLLKLWGGSL